MRLTALLIFLAIPALAWTQSAPAVGDRAPQFSLPYATRDSIAHSPMRLADELGHGPVVVAFYPADWSPGCTKEVSSLRDDFQRLVELRATVLPISGDYVFSHHEWAKHQNLPFPLLSDHSHLVARSYGSYDAASGFNRRTVFLLDSQGRIVYENLNYSVKDGSDFQKLKDALAGLH